MISPDLLLPGLWSFVVGCLSSVGGVQALAGHIALQGMEVMWVWMKPDKRQEIDSDNQTRSREKQQTIKTIKHMHHNRFSATSYHQ